MARRLIFTMKKIARRKNSYEVKVEYMPGNVKTFIGTSFPWVMSEVEKALDSRVPTLSGVIKLEEDNGTDT
jgi:dihydroxyacetone kinase DhaKLM complex PTS-EIIA-like component DhaM